MMLSTKEKIAIWLSSRENQAKLIILGWYISLGMLMLGYVIMAYIFFVL